MGACSSFCGGCGDDADRKDEMRINIEPATPPSEKIEFHLVQAIEQQVLTPEEMLAQKQPEEEQKQPEQPEEGKNDQENFDDWIQSIEEQRADKEFMNMFTIRQLIREGHLKFKNANQPALNKEKLQDLYDKWFGGNENHTLDQDDAIERLRDMFEAMQNPIDDDCKSCSDMGKACFKNDNGHSHRINQGDECGVCASPKNSPYNNKTKHTLRNSEVCGSMMIEQRSQRSQGSQKSGSRCGSRYSRSGSRRGDNNLSFVGEINNAAEATNEQSRGK